LIRSYGLLVAIGLGIGIYLIRTWLVQRRPARLEGLILRLPIIGPLVAQYAMARFCRMLGTLLPRCAPGEWTQRGAAVDWQSDSGRCRVQLD